MEILSKEEVMSRITNNFYLKKEIDALKYEEAVFIKSENWNYKTTIQQYYHTIPVKEHCKVHKYKLVVRKVEGGALVIKKSLNEKYENI